MKHIVFITTSIVLLIFVVLFAGYRWWIQNTSAVSVEGTTQRFIIPKGSSAESIATNLQKENLIRSSLAFKIYVQLTDRAGLIQSGEFNLSPNLSLYQVVEALLGGPDELWVTIPEGLRREEVAERFIRGLEMEEADAENFRTSFLSLSNGQEGYLFPDTYLFPRDVSAERVVNKLKVTFTEKTNNLDGKSLAKYTFPQILTMASLIEKEATGSAEDPQRPIIAGILYKRLDAGWPLQVDAAVQYAVASRNCSGKINCAWWPSALTREDLEIVSAYNTYKNTGLPPSPIANPGLSSIIAAMNPEESEYWYYIHGTDGVIRYAKNNAEHNENIRNYLGR